MKTKFAIRLSRKTEQLTCIYYVILSVGLLKTLHKLKLHEFYFQMSGCFFQGTDKKDDKIIPLFKLVVEG